MNWLMFLIINKIYAQNGQDIPTKDIPTEIQPLPPTADFTVADVIVSIIRYLLSFSAALAVLAIILGGIRYIISGGNQEAVVQAKKIILYSLLGIIVIILSFVIVNFVKNTTPVIVP